MTRNQFERRFWLVMMALVWLLIAFDEGLLKAVVLFILAVIVVIVINFIKDGLWRMFCPRKGAK